MTGLTSICSKPATSTTKTPNCHASGCQSYGWFRPMSRGGAGFQRDTPREGGVLSDIDRTDTRAIRRNHGRTIMGNQVQAECASGCTPLAITARCIGGQAIVGGPRS